MNKAAPIGTISTDKNGRTTIKVGYRQWRRYDKYVWEQAHGVKLKPSDIIIHLDGKKDNFAVENLFMIPRNRATYVFMNIKYPTDVATMGLLCAMADLHAQVRRKEVDVYGSSLGALKEQIMNDSARKAEYMARQRKRANARRAKDPEKARQQSRDWQHRNNDKLRIAHSRYRAANKEKVRAWQKAWRDAHKEQRAASNKKYYDAHREQICEQKRQKRKVDGKNKV